MEGGDLQGGSARSGILLVVSAQSAVTSPAPKELLDEPAFALHTKALVYPDEGGVVAPQGGFDPFQQKQRPCTLSHVSRQHHAFEPVAARIAQRHPLAPAQPFDPVIAMRPPFPWS